MVNPEILTANLVNSKQTIARQTGVIKNCIALNLQTSSHRGELKPQVTLRARLFLNHGLKDLLKVEVGSAKQSHCMQFAGNLVIS